MMVKTQGITGRHVLLMLIGFFGVIFVANAIFITLAVKSFPGEAEEKSYMQGLNYNEVLIERASQAALGWQAQITRAERTENGGLIEMRLFDAEGRALPGLAIDGVLKRPTYAGDDVALVFVAMGGGVYQAKAAVLDAGAWDFNARAESATGERFDISSRIFVE